MSIPYHRQSNKLMGAGLTIAVCMAVSGIVCETSASAAMASGGRRVRRIGPFTLIGGGEIISRRPPTPKRPPVDFLARARESLASGNLASARLALQRAGATTASASAVRQVQSDLANAAQAELDRAQRLQRLGQPLAAMKVYQRLAAAMGESRTGRQAREQLLAIRNAPETASAIQERTAARLWAALVRITQPSTTDSDTESSSLTPASCDALLTAVAGLPLAKKAKAFQIIEKLATKYPDCPTGQAAMELRLRILADTDIADQAITWNETRAARRLFHKAQTYHKARLLDRAAQFYREFLVAYPADARSAEARRILLSIEKNPRISRLY